MSSFTEKMDELVPEMIIHTVAFDHVEGTIEIAYAEMRDQAEGMGLVKTIGLERELFYSEVVGIESDLRDLVDEVMTCIRNKDAREERIKRAVQRLNPKKDDDDDDDDDEGD